MKSWVYAPPYARDRSGHDFAPRGLRPEREGIWVIRSEQSRREASDDLRAAASHPSKLDLQTYISAKLQQLRTLPEGWDGGSGRAVAQAVTHQAYRVLDHLTTSRSVFPFLTPTDDGGVLAEWRAGRERIEVEFSPDDPPYGFAAGSDGITRIDEYLNSSTSLAKTKRLLEVLSGRVWAENPTWRTLFS
ncbi:hypothetical protein [Kitasatospora sp. NPDC096140]|uniref:hypothetical protein n=1 Tax=Kitasatospora sp. NPDC096140 TaxID=3155425 RepID=UPI00333301FB